MSYRVQSQSPLSESNSLVPVYSRGPVARLLVNVAIRGQSLIVESKSASASGFRKEIHSLSASIGQQQRSIGGTCVEYRFKKTMLTRPRKGKKQIKLIEFPTNQFANVIFFCAYIFDFGGDFGQPFYTSGNETAAIKLGCIPKSLGNLIRLLDQTRFNFDADRFHSPQCGQHGADTKTCSEFAKTITGK